MMDKDKKEELQEYGQVKLSNKSMGGGIQLITIIGEIEGHEALTNHMKTTQYEHILPNLVSMDSDEAVQGILILINTVGGDVSCGLAIAEMIASLSKPTVALVIGDSHSIGVPLAVASDYSFIVPTGTMIIHPVRMNGMVIGAPQTYDYFKLIQERILSFISEHSHCKKERLEQMMFTQGLLTKDLGTILVGEQAVKEGVLDEVGGIKEAVCKLREMMKNKTCVCKTGQM